MPVRPGEPRVTDRLDGVLVVDKPAGPTSHDVVARVRRVLGVRRVGHTGTLDPLATGVLALVVGRATRLAQFFSATSKDYVAWIRLGFATDTYDAAGRPLPPADPDRPAVLPRADQIAACLAGFLGERLQTPPSFSAKKVGGVRAHRLARQQRPQTLAAVPVTAERLEILALEHDRVQVFIRCSAGFYVRSLAHDLGAELGCGGHLDSLRRLRSGEFDVETAVPLAVLEEEAVAAADRLIPLGEVLRSLPGITLSGQGVTRAAHGAFLTGRDLLHPDDAGPLTAVSQTGRVRLLDADGALIAIGEAREGLLHPVVVLS